jgi:hypothetical protein
VLLPRAQWQEENTALELAHWCRSLSPLPAHLGQDVAYIGSHAWRSDAINTAHFEQISRRRSPVG